MALVAALAAIAVPGRGAPAVARVENGGLLFTDNQAGISGVDAGFSIPMGRKTLWLFGDVFLLDPVKPSKPYVGGVSNCGLIVPSGKGSGPLRRYTVLTDAQTGLARQLVPDLPGEGDNTRLWPMSGWYDAASKRLYVYYADVKITGPSTYDFRSDGNGLAVADASNPAALRFERLKAKGATVWWPNDDQTPQLGTSVVSAGPGVGDRLYVYGHVQKGGRTVGVLARVSRSRVAVLSEYEYFAGTAGGPLWASEPAKAVPVEGLSDFPSELSVSWNPYLGGWLAVHNLVLEDRIRLSLAPDPWGPFREIAVIGAPRQALRKDPCYAGKEHPELAEEGGRIIYITYVDSSRYWLQLLKVTLQR
jgi:hypothetical protein